MKNQHQSFYSLYRRKEWFEFRESCLNLAGRKCERCCRNQEEASLQVHHPYYHENLMPWQYDQKFCQVLCKSCHAQEHKIIKPTNGWILIHSDWDVGEPTGMTRCEHCDAFMEWHNDLWHPEWGIITVGYECADKLGVPEIHEIKRKNERLKTFINSPRWKQTLKGWKYKHADKSVFALQKTDGWILNINGRWGKMLYKTINEAKQRAFNFLEL